MRMPANQFGHMRAFPDATFTDVVRANVDTLYSSLWFDVSQEPLVIAVPTRAAATTCCPCSTCGATCSPRPASAPPAPAPQTYAITGPGWSGTLPEGRDANRGADGDGLDHRPHADQREGRLRGGERVPGRAARRTAERLGQDLSAAAGEGRPERGHERAGRAGGEAERGEVLRDLRGRSRARTRRTSTTGPCSSAWRASASCRASPFDLAKAPPETKAALEAAPAAAMAKIRGVRSARGDAGERLGDARLADRHLRHRLPEARVRRLLRARRERGRGRDLPGRARAGGREALRQRREVHASTSPRQKLPPARAFWSLTLYNDKQFLAANPIDRFAIGDRDALKFNADGSLDLYIQRESPGQGAREQLATGAREQARSR